MEVKPSCILMEKTFPPSVFVKRILLIESELVTAAQLPFKMINFSVF